MVKETHRTLEAGIGNYGHAAQTVQGAPRLPKSPLEPSSAYTELRSLPATLAYQLLSVPAQRSGARFLAQNMRLRSCDQVCAYMLRIFDIICFHISLVLLVATA